MAIKTILFLYSFILFFANNSFVFSDETKKIVFNENPIVIKNLLVFDNNEKQVDILKLEHNLLLINFWATWCKPCTDEMPLLNELQSEFNEKKLRVITIATGRNNPKKITEFFDKYELTNLKNYKDPNGKLALKLGVIGLPYSIIVSKSGKNLGQLIGPIDWSKKEVEKLFLRLIEKNI